MASPLARWQVESGSEVISNLGHRAVMLDEFQRRLLPLLDGTRDATQLTAELVRRAQSGELNVQLDDGAKPDPAQLEQILGQACRRGLHVLAKSLLLAE